VVNLAGRTCLTLGYHAGTLSCGSDCRLELSDCEANGRCGDGWIQEAFSEVCDGDTGGQTCVGLGYWGGELTCGANCLALDLGACEATGRCGDGSVRCWGRNYFGKLGDGTTTDRWVPTAVSDPGDAIGVALGGDHTCAVLSSGGVKCWGRNDNGQLGLGTTTETHTPANVNVASSTQVTAGGHHCWGSNANGKLGDGTFVLKLTPGEVLP